MSLQPEPILECRDLTRSYPSGFVLGPVDLALTPGEVCGIVGVNGAGKTTLMRTLAGILRPDRGAVRILGQDLHGASPGIRRWIGYQDEEQIIYDWMKPETLGRFLSPFFPDWDAPYYRELLVRLEVTPDRKVGDMSKGNRVKLALASVLARRSKILILDEPTSGLDPGVRRMVLEVIEEFMACAAGKAAVLISSHITSDLERICHRVMVLDHGRMGRTIGRSEFALSTDKEPTLEDLVLDPSARRKVNGSGGIDLDPFAPRTEREQP